MRDTKLKIWRENQNEQKGIYRPSITLPLPVFQDKSLEAIPHTQSQGTAVTSGFPSSFDVMESSNTRSWNLYVSQQIMTGFSQVFAIIATPAEPTLDMTVPLDITAAAPRKTFVTSCKVPNRSNDKSTRMGNNKANL